MLESLLAMLSVDEREPMAPPVQRARYFGAERACRARHQSYVGLGLRGLGHLAMDLYQRDSKLQAESFLRSDHFGKKCPRPGFLVADRRVALPGVMVK